MQDKQMNGAKQNWRQEQIYWVMVERNEQALVSIKLVLKVKKKHLPDKNSYKERANNISYDALDNSVSFLNPWTPSVEEKNQCACKNNVHKDLHSVCGLF